jgi:hypothetical protein
MAPIYQMILILQEKTLKSHLDFPLRIKKCDILTGCITPNANMLCIGIDNKGDNRTY